MCSGRDAPPQAELTLCLRDAEPEVAQGGAAGEQALETQALNEYRTGVEATGAFNKNKVRLLAQFLFGGFKTHH